MRMSVDPCGLGLQAYVYTLCLFFLFLNHSRSPTINTPS